MYAGLAVIPVLLVLSITGGIYLFKPQYDEWRQHDIRTVTPADRPAVPIQDQVATVMANHPGASIDSVTPPSAPDRATRVVLEGDGSGHFAPGIAVYVDPYTNRELGSVNEATTFMRRVRDLHGSLLAGKYGDYVVEIAACWSVILAASGVFLALRGRALRRTGKLRLRSVHGWTGITAAVVIVFLVLSGLPWSGFWGTRFEQVAAKMGSTSGGPSASALVGGSNSGHAGHLTEDHEAKVPWATGRLPVPGSHDHRGDRKHRRAAVDDVLVIAASEGVTGQVSVLMPTHDTPAFVVTAASSKDPSEQRTVVLSEDTATPLGAFGWPQYSLLAKGVEQGIALHEGRRFGPLNQALMLLAALGVVLLCVSGPLMWWKRRPSRVRKGMAPPRRADRRTARMLAAIMLLLGLVFPLAGAVMLTVLVLDALVIRRITALRTRFG
jgi:uncharacterized iron-regulated membrane protein